MTTNAEPTNTENTTVEPKSLLQKRIRVEDHGGKILVAVIIMNIILAVNGWFLWNGNKNCTTTLTTWIGNTK